MIKHRFVWVVIETWTDIGERKELRRVYSSYKKAKAHADNHPSRTYDLHREEVR